MVQATMGVYTRTMETFLPTPTKSHYVFNLRDFARVIRGILLVPGNKMETSDKFIRLWVHEVYRLEEQFVLKSSLTICLYAAFLKVYGFIEYYNLI